MFTCYLLWAECRAAKPGRGPRSSSLLFSRLFARVALPTHVPEACPGAGLASGQLRSLRLRQRTPHHVVTSSRPRGESAAACHDPVAVPDSRREIAGASRLSLSATCRPKRLCSVERAVRASRALRLRRPPGHVWPRLPVSVADPAPPARGIRIASSGPAQPGTAPGDAMPDLHRSAAGGAPVSGCGPAVSLPPVRIDAPVCNGGLWCARDPALTPAPGCGSVGQTATNGPARPRRRKKSDSWSLRAVSKNPRAPGVAQAPRRHAFAARDVGTDAQQILGARSPARPFPAT